MTFPSLLEQTAKKALFLVDEIIPDEEGIDLLSHARLFRSLQWKIPGSKKSLQRKPCFPSIYRSKCPETSHPCFIFAAFLRYKGLI